MPEEQGVERPATGAKWRLAGQAAILAVMVGIAYLPVLRAGFIWDDDRYVTANPLLTDPNGLREIWFSAHHQSQYFPLVYTTFLFERLLWDLNPLGYHIVNVLLHALNAILAWMVLRRLSLRGAWFAAAIFALHPVQVESVAWITELKNVESTVFYLLTLLVWMRFIEKGQARWHLFALALFLYALALFSKTTACTLPAALVLILWLRGEIGWRKYAQVLPFLTLGIAMGVVSVWWERHLGGYDRDVAKEVGLSLSGLERLLVATRALWFYAWKLMWPANLTFSYPHWQIDVSDPTQYVWGTLSLSAGVWLLWRRRALGRAPIAGVVFFVAALSPLLGLIPLYTFRYSFVADHYQYLASLGLISLFAGAMSGQGAAQSFGRAVRTTCSVLLLLVLGGLTWRQASLYRSNESIWRDTAAKNPGSWMANNYVAFYAQRDGRLQEAIGFYRKSVQIYPNVEAYFNLAQALAQAGRGPEAISSFRKAVQLKPTLSVGHLNLGVLLASQGQFEEALAEYRRVIELDPKSADGYYCLGTALERLNQTGEAIKQYRLALRLDPRSAGTLNNLAVILGADRRPEFRDGPEAVRLAEQACELTGFKDHMYLITLAMAYAEAGGFQEAVAAAEKARDMADAAGSKEDVEQCRRLAELFKTGTPYRERAAPNGNVTPNKTE